MKLLPLLFAGTLLGNVALVSIHLSNTESEGETRGWFSGRSGTATAAGREAPASMDRVAEAAQTGRRPNGAALGASDPGSLAQRLRNAGFPADIVTSVEKSLLYESFGARRAALMTGAEDFAFWKPGAGMGAFLMSPEIRTSMREIDRELQARLKAIDGEGAPGGSMSDYFRRRYGDIPPEKLQALQTIESDYNDLRNDVFSARAGLSLLPDDQEKLALLEREQRADVAKVLTPEELFEFDVRNSPTANRLRTQLQGFTPSEAEFRAIFKVQQALEEKAGTSNHAFTTPSGADRQALRAELLKELEGTLPPGRLADLETVTDPAQSVLSRLTARLGLPLDAAREVAAVQRDTQRKLAEVRANRDLPPAERNQRLSALNAEATAKVTAVLGPRGLEAYREFGGSWLQVQPSINPAGEASRPGTTR